MKLIFSIILLTIACNSYSKEFTIIDRPMIDKYHILLIEKCIGGLSFLTTISYASEVANTIQIYKTNNRNRVMPKECEK